MCPLFAVFVLSMTGESCTTLPSPCLLPGVCKVAAGETGNFLLFKKKMKKKKRKGEKERKLLFGGVRRGRVNKRVLATVAGVGLINCHLWIDLLEHQMMAGPLSFAYLYLPWVPGLKAGGASRKLLSLFLY